MEKKRIQPRDILKISWFLSSVLCCAFWELCGGKSAFNPEISWGYLGFYLLCFVVLFGSFVVEKSAFNPEIS